MIATTTADSSKELTVGCYNARGLVTALPFIRKQLAHIDILAVTEHWLYQDALPELDKVMNSHRGWGRADNRLKEFKHTTGWRRGQGGVALLWKESIDYAVHKLEDGNDRIIGVRVRLQSGQKIFVFAAYMPHSGLAIDNYREHLDIMTELYRKYENEGEVIFVGDFNADLGEQGGPRGRGQPSKLGKELWGTLDELDLFSLNLSHLCKGPLHTFQANGDKHLSTIDHILIPYSLLTEAVSCKVIGDCSLNLSDHSPIVASFVNKPNEFEETVIRPKLNWHRDGDQTLKEAYKKRVSERLESNSAPATWSAGSIEKDLDTITTILRTTGEEVIPANKCKKHQKPYWSPTLTEAHQQQVSAWMQWKEGGKPREKENQLYKA